MSKVKFTPEQQQLLRNNPYTLRVTENVLNLSKEFKELFYKEYLAGAPGELPDPGNGASCFLKKSLYFTDSFYTKYALRLTSFSVIVSEGATRNGRRLVPRQRVVTL